MAGSAKTLLLNKKGRLDGLCYVCRTSLGNSLRHLVVALDRGLIPVIAEVGRLVVRFRRTEPTSQACHQFEIQLHDRLRELGRIIVEWTFNHIEPHDRADMPNQICFQGVWYRRRAKTPNRKVATLFGTITVWRMLYQPPHGVEPSIFPLEIRLGLEAGLATPALTERVAQAAPATTQTRCWPLSNGIMACVGRSRPYAKSSPGWPRG